MRSLTLLLLVLVACDRQSGPASFAGRQSAGPIPSAAKSGSATLNGTPLELEPASTPIAPGHVEIISPQPGETIAVLAPRLYEVRLELQALEADATVEVGLDGQRPRRLATGQSALTLAQLLAVDAELSPGAHWVFAAVVSAAGLVPRPDAGEPRAAVACLFFVGGAAGSSAESGTVWLRRPDGTYNGADAASRVLIDAFAFSATGALHEAPPRLTFEGPGMRGELQSPSPFWLREVPSGDYAIEVPGAVPLRREFTVNRELGPTP